MKLYGILMAFLLVTGGCGGTSVGNPEFEGMPDDEPEKGFEEEFTAQRDALQLDWQATKSELKDRETIDTEGVVTFSGINEALTAAEQRIATKVESCLTMALPDWEDFQRTTESLPQEPEGRRIWEEQRRTFSAQLDAASEAFETCLVSDVEPAQQLLIDHCYYEATEAERSELFSHAKQIRDVQAELETAEAKLAATSDRNEQERLMGEIEVLREQLENLRASQQESRDPRDSALYAKALATAESDACQDALVTVNKMLE